MKEFWNERYGKTEYAYGIKPNEYLKVQLDKLDLGTILLPAEGEGRNAVYAAKKGWKVSAFDISEEGQRKASELARTNKVSIDYKVGELQTLNYGIGQFDAIALIYAHFPSNLKVTYHKLLDTYLKTGGIILFEAFSKKHINYNSKNEKVGGPKDVGILFSKEEINDYFPNYEIIELEEKEIELNEGLFHIGTGSVIRFVGMKKE